MLDNLGDRIKQYENEYRNYLPLKSHVIIRIDGKNFSKYTKNLAKPFDLNFSEAMLQAALKVFKETMNAKFAYVQSDEVSIYLSDLASEETQAWFGNNIQKITSISASVMTANFNRLFQNNERLAYFDSRGFIVPNETEVANYFIWRHQDCIRNSIQKYAFNYFSPKQMHKKTIKELKIELLQEGYNWEFLSDSIKYGSFKYGSFISRFNRDFIIKSAKIKTFNDMYDLIFANSLKGKEV